MIKKIIGWILVLGPSFLIASVGLYIGYGTKGFLIAGVIFISVGIVVGIMKVGFRLICGEWI